jgi:hypothetical protein
MTTENQSESKNSSMHAAPPSPGMQRVSIDPIVAQVHAVREQQWQLYGEDTKAWFDALLLSQARRVNVIR